METFACGIRNVTLIAATLAFQPAFAGPGHHLAAFAYARLPLQFEANRGQADEQVKFLSRGGEHALLLAPSETVLALGRRGEHQTIVRTRFVGSDPRAAIAGEQELAGKVNYLIGTDPGKWRTNIATYARVRYEALYPGIDLVFHGRGGTLEYDFVVAPGADPALIALRIDGAARLKLSPSGDLVIDTPNGALRYRKPFIYQERNGVKQQVAGGYILKSPNRVAFKLASYDATRALVIDPVIVYSTYVIGSGDLTGVGGIALDTKGNVYLAGVSRGPDLGSFWEAYVAKVNSDGTALHYLTYLGGNSEDNATGIAVDASGNAYVTGKTRSTNFPTTAGVFQPAFHNQNSQFSQQDLFVTKLNSTGTALLYSTYLGGSGSEDDFAAIAIDSVGNAYVTGRTASSDFPTTPGVFQTSGWGAFVTKLNSDATALIYSTYLGTGINDGTFSIAVDASGNCYVTGVTRSTTFPTTPAAFQRALRGSSDAFAMKINPQGTALIYSTYLGGNNDESGNAIAIDSGGNAYVTGSTDSTDFPTTPGAFQTVFGGVPNDAFVTKLNADGSALVYSTYLGGGGSDSGGGIAVDAAGSAYVGGRTNSRNFPTTSNAFQRSLNGSYDAIVSKLNSDGTRLAYSSYLGGGGSGSQYGQYGTSIALDGYGNAYVAGATDSNDFPVTQDAVQGNKDGKQTAAFLVKFKFAATSADFNADGFSDVLWRNNSTGENYIYPMQGTTVLGGEGYVRTVPDPDWKIVGIGDFNGDGKSDILWRNSTTGENYIYMMNGMAIANEGYIRSVADRNWQVAGVGDFDGDGKDDIVWRNAATGENYLYLMSAFDITSEGYLRTVADTSWKIVAVADVDGDSKADILWRNAATGQNYVHPMNGTAIKTTEGYFRTVANQNWRVAGVADLDGDGKADIVWRNAATGENYLYPMDGKIIKPSEAYFRTVADLNWQIAALGDYDGDGKSDLVWRNSATGENYLYPMDGSTIKPGEGYFRRVADMRWQIQQPR
jgi:hypothetical protein